MDLHLGNVMVYQPPVKQFGLKAGEKEYSRFHPNNPFVFVPIDFGLMGHVGDRVTAYNTRVCCSHLPKDGTISPCCDSTGISKLAASIGTCVSEPVEIDLSLVRTTISSHNESFAESISKKDELFRSFVPYQQSELEPVLSEEGEEEVEYNSKEEEEQD